MDQAVMLRMLMALIVAGVYQCHGVLMLEAVAEAELLMYLHLFDRHDVQDLIDGVGSASGRQSIPMEERFWHRVGRVMPSRNFLTLFRCT